MGLFGRRDRRMTNDSADSTINDTVTDGRDTDRHTSHHHDRRRLSRSEKRHEKHAMKAGTGSGTGTGIGHRNGTRTKGRRQMFDIDSGHFNRRPTFGQWLKFIWVDLLTMACMGAIGLGVYNAGPAPSRSFPVTFPSGDIVYPQFAYPLRNEIITIWAAALIASLVPICVILLMQIRVRSFWDVNNAVVGLLYSLITAAVFQVFIKWLIGGLRPHFLSVCDPDPALITAGGNGFRNVMFQRDICRGDRKQINDSLESMPSGHSTAAFAGLLYLYFYLNAKLKVFSNHHPSMWKLVLLYSPVLGACLIAGTLTIDEFHNWYDCLAGAVIGSVMAISAYRMVYASVWDFRFNHIPLTRHTPFSYGAGAAGAGGFETAVFTRKAGWGFEEAYGGAPFDAAHGLRGNATGFNTGAVGLNGTSRHDHGDRNGVMGGRGRHHDDVEHNALDRGHTTNNMPVERTDTSHVGAMDRNVTGIHHHGHHDTYDTTGTGVGTGTGTGTGITGHHGHRDTYDTTGTGTGTGVTGHHGHRGHQDTYDSTGTGSGGKTGTGLLGGLFSHRSHNNHKDNYDTTGSGVGSGVGTGTGTGTGIGNHGHRDHHTYQDTYDNNGNRTGTGMGTGRETGTSTGGGLLSKLTHHNRGDNYDTTGNTSGTGTGIVGNHGHHNHRDTYDTTGSGTGTGTGTGTGILGNHGNHGHHGHHNEQDTYNTSGTGIGSGMGTNSSQYPRAPDIPADDEHRYRSHSRSMERKAVPHLR